MRRMYHPRQSDVVWEGNNEGKEGYGVISDCRSCCHRRMPCGAARALEHVESNVTHTIQFHTTHELLLGSVRIK